MGQVRWKAGSAVCTIWWIALEQNAAYSDKKVVPIINTLLSLNFQNLLCCEWEWLEDISFFFSHSAHLIRFDSFWLRGIGWSHNFVDWSLRWFICLITVGDHNPNMQYISLVFHQMQWERVKTMVQFNIRVQVWRYQMSKWVIQILTLNVCWWFYWY